MEKVVSAGAAADGPASDRAVGTRIERLTEGMTLPEAAALAGCSVNTLRRWIKGEGAADARGLLRLARGKGVTVEWLLSGESANPATQAADYVQATVNHTVNALAQPKASATLIPIPAPNLAATVPIRVLNVTVSAGNGAVNGEVLDERRIDFPAIFLRGETDIEHLSLLRVAGDSMEPDLRAGDWVLVDDRRREDAGIHVIRRDDQLTVKRIQRQGGTMRLLSSNPLYSTEEIDLAKEGDAFGVVGKVIWGGRWF